MLIPSIYIDLDDVIAETLRAFTRLVNRMYGKSIRFESIYSFDLGQSFDLDPGQLNKFMEVAHSRDTLLHEVSANAQARIVLQEWAAFGTHITIVTGRPISTYNDTLDWINLNKIPFNALRFLRKYGRNDLGHTVMRPLDIRTLSSATFLFGVEDNAKMAHYLATRTKTPVLLLDKPWNRQQKVNNYSPLVTRCSDWDAIRSRSLYFLQNTNNAAIR